MYEAVSSAGSSSRRRCGVRIGASIPTTANGNGDWAEVHKRGIFVTGVNQLESRTYPSFPRRGGCAPPRNGPVPRRRSRGGLFPSHNHPGRSKLVAATPPWKGGECPRFQFIHALIDRDYG